MNPVKFPSLPILLVDDEERFLMSASLLLDSRGMNHVVQCPDSRHVMSWLGEQEFSLVMLDLRMPHISGADLLPMICQDFPQLPTIVVTAVNELETAVECMKQGAFYYLVKPLNNDIFIETIQRALQFGQLQAQNGLLKDYLLSDTLKHPEMFLDIVTEDRAMRSIFQYIEAISMSPMPVMITGETGVGKNLIAHIIHKLSGVNGQFVPVNVAGVDDNLFSDTLFGHHKGAFTGADQVRQGLIEQASGGTVFLDEIGTLSIESQVKLLHLLQEGRYYPLGADISKSSNARVIVATNQELESMLETGEFRKDLYYRLKTHHIHLPALRDRRGDIPLLVEHFLEKAAETLGKKKPTPPKELFTWLSTYHFPGNIRELESLVFDAVSRHQSGVLSMESFKEKIHPQPADRMTLQTSGTQTNWFSSIEQLPTLNKAEGVLIAESLKRAEGNQTLAAQLLGISRKTLVSRLIRSRH
ncbi:MAG: sigma-54 dependent transcriptional regulator [Ignavibacteria bacterium]|nr:sigma-54 dependent transcriptional regulator [Ignavibacteria bacterium]